MTHKLYPFTDPLTAPSSDSSESSHNNSNRPPSVSSINLAILLLLSALALILYISHIPKSGFGSDLWWWKKWSTAIKEHGFHEIYSHGSNYPPGFLYVLWGFSALKESPAQIAQDLPQLKIFCLVFDIFAALIAVIISPLRSRCVFHLLLLIANAGFLYNTLIWGQVDGLYTFFVFLSLLCCIKGKYSLGALSFILAVQIKLQAIIFLPVVGLLILKEREKFHSKKAISSLLLPAVSLQLLILLPFLYSGTYASLFAAIAKAPQYYPYVTVGACNVWNVILGSDHLNKLLDTTPWLGLTYKAWGLIFFFLSSLIVLIPLLSSVWQVLLKKNSCVTFPQEKVWLTAGLLSCCFYYFATEMHERYCHPMVLFFALSAFSTGRYSLFLCASLLNLILLERLMLFLPFSLNSSFFGNAQILGAAFGMMILCGVISLFRNDNRAI